MNGGKFEVGQDEVTVTAPERTMDCTERPRCDTNEGVAIEVTVTSEEEHRSRKEQRGFWDRGRRERKKEGDVHSSNLNLGLYLITAT